MTPEDKIRLVNALKDVDYKMERPSHYVRWFNQLLNCGRCMSCNDTTPTNVFTVTIRNIEPRDMEFIQNLALDAGCAVEVSSRRKTIKIFYLPESSYIYLALENRTSRSSSLREIPIDDVDREQTNNKDVAKTQ